MSINDKNPQGTALAPEGTAIAPEGTAIAPEGTAIAPEGTAASGKSTSTSSNRTSANATAKDPGIAIGTEITIDGKKYRVIRRFSSGSEADLYEVKSGLKSFGLKIYRKGFHPNTKVIPLVQKLKGKGYLADVHSFGSVSVNGKSYEYELMDYYGCGPANAMNMKGKTQAILAIAFKTALTLDACHKAGFIHKDVKPANILITDSGSYDCVLCDFGIADVLKNGETSTKQTRTPIYAAPEIYDPKNATAIVDGENLFVITPKADYYSLGMTILSLWYGESAFRSKETEMSVTKLTTGIQVPNDMPDPLYTIVRGLLIKNPNKRWDLDEIQDFLNGKNFCIDESKILEDLNILYNAGKHQIANTTEDLAFYMLEDMELAQRYLYKGKVKEWLKSRPELQEEMEHIVEKRYPKDMYKGVLAAVFALDPSYGFPLKGTDRKTGKTEVVMAHSSQEVIDFCTSHFCNEQTKENIASELFIDWLQHLGYKETWALKPIVPKYTRDTIKDLENDIVFRLRIQTMDPLCDICLCNDINDPNYAMTGERIGKVINEAYQTILVDFEDDVDSLTSTHPDWQLMLNLLESESYENSYLHRFFETKGNRFFDHDRTLKAEMDRMKHPDSRKIGPKDGQLEGFLFMRLISAYGHKPTYRFKGTNITVSDQGDLKWHMSKKQMLKNAFYKESFSGWLAVQYQENPHADFSQKYSYEKALVEYTRLLGRIDPENAYYRNYLNATKDAKARIKDGMKRIRRVNSRAIFQKILATIFGVLPLLFLITCIALTLTESPVISSKVEFEGIFKSVGIIVAILVLISGESNGCLECIIAGAIVSGIVWAVLRFLAPYLLWFYIAVAVIALIYFSIKTIFNFSRHAKLAKKYSKPGFEELELEPIHYAYSNDSYFDSSISGAFNEYDIDKWRNDVKARRKRVIFFIITAWIMLILSTFLPETETLNKFNMAVRDKATELVVPEDMTTPEQKLEKLKRAEERAVKRAERAKAKAEREAAKAKEAAEKAKEMNRTVNGK